MVYVGAPALHNDMRLLLFVCFGLRRYGDIYRISKQTFATVMYREAFVGLVVVVEEAILTTLFRIR